MIKQESKYLPFESLLLRSFGTLPLQMPTLTSSILMSLKFNKTRLFIQYQRVLENELFQKLKFRMVSKIGL